MQENFCIAAFRSRLQVMTFEEALRQHGMAAEIVTTPRAVRGYIRTVFRLAWKNARRRNFYPNYVQLFFFCPLIFPAKRVIMYGAGI